MKHIFKLMLAIISLFILVSCKTNNNLYDEDNFLETGDKIVKEKITLKFFAPLHPLHHPDGYNAMRLFQKMEEITNIHIEWDYGPTQTYAEKKAIAIKNIKEYDGYFLWNTLKDQINLAQYDAIRPIDDLIDKYMPNYKEILENNPELIKLAKLPNGKMYSPVAINDTPRDQTFKQFINQKWLDNLNLEMPETIDEYYDVLKAFKNNDPNLNGINDEIPLSSTRLGNLSSFIMSSFGYVSTGIELNNNNEITYVPTTNNYKEYLKFMIKLYEEGLLDNSYFTMNQSDLTAKGNRVGSFDGAAAYLVVSEKYDDDYTAIPPLTSDINPNKVWLGFHSNSPQTFMIPSHTPYYREIARWIDFLYSEKGRQLQAFGEEGKDWQWDDENQSSFTFNVPKGMNIESYRGRLTPSVGLGIVTYFDKDFVLKENNKIINNINNAVENAGYLDYLKIPMPVLNFTDSENTELAIIQTDLDIYLDSFEERIISGKSEFNDDIWEEHLSRLNRLKISRLIEIYNDALNRYNNS